MTADRNDDEVRRWSSTFLAAAAGLSIPPFGSDDWVASTGIVRVASAVAAGVAWYEDADPHRLAARLEMEMEAARRYDEADYDGWRAVAARVRRLAVEPTHAELQHRRAS